MSIKFIRCGRHRKYCHALGVSLQHGWFIFDELDETRQALMLKAGFWWFTVVWTIWREK